MINTESVLHGFTDLKNLDHLGPIVLNQAKGIYVYDQNGKKYLDANSGLWNSVVGFDHPRMIEAAKKQYEKFSGYHSFFGRIAEPAVALADKLIEISPFNKGKVFFTNSGSEANDTTVKLLWFINRKKGLSNKRKIITRINSYHGVTAVSASMTGKPYNSEFGLPLDGFIHAACPHYWKNAHDGESEESFTKRMGEDLENIILREGADTIAGFFAEPVMGAGGVIPPSKGYFDVIQKILKKYDIPLIADEVICGFGRTGNVWGAETFNMKPVSITVAKALSSSYLPISAVIISDDCYDIVAQKSDELGIFGHGYTYSGHPVACAVAVKTLEIYERDDMLGHVNKVSPTFIERLNKCDQYDLVGNTRGIGLIGAMEFVSERNSNKGFEKKGVAGKIFADHAKDNGLIVRAIGDVIAFCPPLIITESQINDMFDIVEESLKKTMDELAKQGLLK